MQERSGGIPPPIQRHFITGPLKPYKNSVIPAFERAAGFAPGRFTLLPDGTPGPFINLSTLRYGDQVIVHAFGERYIYEVRTEKEISPLDMTVPRHEAYPWVTLLTCKDYDERTGTYRHRIAVRAARIRVEPDP